MKLKVLVDNNTFIDNYYYGEPAVSYYIEDGDSKILFDVGNSDLFIKNAEAFKIDLSKLTDLVISHGHEDHTGGIGSFFERFDIPNLKITAHTRAFNEKQLDGMELRIFRRRRNNENRKLEQSQYPFCAKRR